MAGSQLSHGQTALVRRALATAQKDIERAERKFSAEFAQTFPDRTIEDDAHRALRVVR